MRVLAAPQMRWLWPRWRRKTRKKGIRDEYLSDQLVAIPPRSARIVGVSEPEIAGGTPREEPADGPPRKKARSGEAAVDRTEAAGALKSVREAEAIDDVDVNEGTSIGRRRPTTPVPPPD